MRYEVRTGLRYLHGGHRDRVMRRFALISACVCIAGIVMIAAGASSLGVVTLVLGMIATAMFALLSVLTVFTSVSVLGVVLGSAALVVVLAVTTGFQNEFRDKVLGVNAHVIVRRDSYIADYRDVMATAKAIDPDVLAVQPFLFEEVVATCGHGNGAGVGIKGIDPARWREVLDLARYIETGSFSALDVPARPGELPPIIVGRQVATKLGGKLGDVITVVLPLESLGSAEERRGESIDHDGRLARTPRTKRFRVAGIFYSGFEEYDRHLMFATLADTQALAGRGDQAMGVEAKLRDVDRASEIAGKLEAELGPPYQVQGWREMNANLFDALAIQKRVLVIILTLIILVAALNMVSALAMLVTEKTREIAIFKSMGATSGGVARVFRTVGVLIGALGTTIGLAIGLATCHVVSAYGYRLDPKVYMIDRLPVEVQPFEVALVAGIAIVISWIATTVPARAAAALSPVDGLRYD